jgi:hypothetical protein
MNSLYIKRPFQQPNYEIISDDNKLLDMLRLQYGPFICDYPLPDTYCINAEVFTYNPLYEIDSIIFETTVYDSSILALHGSSVEWNGKAYLFLAGTFSGKTTLASYLTSSGFGYITDDCILIDRDSFEVYPYNCPIQLRDGGLEVLEKLGKVPPNLQFLDDAVIQRYIYTPQNCVTQPLPLGGIYFIELNEIENMIVDISTNEKMTELMKSPITNYAITPEYLKLIARLSQKVCGKLIYKDMEFVAKTIKAGEQHG